MKHFPSFLEDWFFLFNDASTQMGLLDTDVCPQLCKLTYDHFGQNWRCENRIYDFFFFFANIPENLYLKLIEERVIEMKMMG